MLSKDGDNVQKIKFSTHTITFKLIYLINFVVLALPIYIITLGGEKCSHVFMETYFILLVICTVLSIFQFNFF